MTTQRINALNPVASNTDTLAFAGEDPSAGNLTKKRTVNQLADQSTILTSSGVLAVNQTALTSLTSTLTSPANTLTATVNGGTASSPVTLVKTNTLSSSVNTLTSTVNGVASSGANIINSVNLTTQTSPSPDINVLELDINGLSTTQHIVTTINGSYTGNVAAVSVNGMGSNSILIDGSNINVKDPTVGSVSDNVPLDTALANINTSGGTFVTATTTATNYHMTNEDILLFNGTSTAIINLPDATVRRKPVRIYNRTAGNTIMNIQPFLGSGQQINTLTGIFNTKGYDNITCYSDGSNWFVDSSGVGFHSNQLVVTTNQLTGGTATYSFYGVDGNFIATVKDNVVDMFFNLQVVVSGSPSTQLITYFDMSWLLGGAQFGDFTHVTGYSKLKTALQYNSGNAYTDDFYVWFDSVSLSPYIRARTTLSGTLLSGTNIMNVNIKFTLPQVSQP